MPVNNILGSSGASPVDLYKFSQTNSSSKQAESTQRSSQNEEVYSVKISQEAFELQKRERERQAEFEQNLQKNSELRDQADVVLERQRAQAKDQAEQQAIDVVV